MSLDLQIMDMAGGPPDHSTVITNFVNMVYNQLKDSTCRVYPDNVQYRWKMRDGSEKNVIPDASINCQIRSRKGNSFLNAPQFVLEVLSPSTAKYDRTEKKRFIGRKKFRNTGSLTFQDALLRFMIWIMKDRNHDII